MHLQRIHKHIRDDFFEGLDVFCNKKLLKDQDLVLPRAWTSNPLSSRSLMLFRKARLNDCQFRCVCHLVANQNTWMQEMLDYFRGLDLNSMHQFIQDLPEGITEISNYFETQHERLSTSLAAAIKTWESNEVRSSPPLSSMSAHKGHPSLF